MTILEKIELGVCEPLLDEIDSPLETVTTKGGYTSFDSLPRFDLVNAGSIAEAVSLLKTHEDQAVLIAGGQNLLRRLRGRVHPASPRVLINVKTIRPALDEIRETNDGLVIGSLVTLRCVETSPIVCRKYPILAQAAYAAGALQYRNLATLGGDLCQQVRCWYFMAEGNAYECRRKGGSECPAAAGNRRHHGIFDNHACIAACPSDVAPALLALGATIVVSGSRGERTVPVQDFFTPMGNVLKPDEMVTGVQLPVPEAGAQGVFRKFAHGNVFDPALVTVAVVARVEDGICRSPRIALGGVSFKPLRATTVERRLAGKILDAAGAAEAAQGAFAGIGLPVSNEYKAEVARVLLERAVLALASAN